MRDLQRYANECLNDMKALGIEVPHIESFTVNTRAKSRFGQCCRRDGKWKININSDLLDEECPVMSLRETIFHEIIHTLPKCFNHGDEFKKYADIVNKAYKTNITRCSTTKEKYGNIYGAKVAAANAVKKEKHTMCYQVYCPNCDKVVAQGDFQRAPKWYAHVERFHCRKCKGNLERLSSVYTIL